MSGTSLDGLDIASCRFTAREDGWDWEILEAETVDYPQEWINRLSTAMTADGVELSRMHIQLGNYIGNCLQSFISQTGERPDMIASHGHTIFHQPEHRLTLQIGAGTEIHAVTGLPVVCDFRTLDLALGGQGAPLVPVGDRFLFGEFDACLNLGGIANISFESNDARIAYDICPCNMPLNRLSAKMGLSFDRDGELAKSGKADKKRLEKLNGLSYYELSPPKSLGQEYIAAEIIPVLNNGSIPDMLRTSVEHTATCIAGAVRLMKKDQPRIVVTGGGAFNGFLMEEMRRILGNDGEFVVPDKRVVAYKEALIFAFLGVLRMKNEINVLASVTGASRDSSSGIIFG